MSGVTTELNLATAVDSDDNADYLTIALANSLRTLDALFNNSTGHTHSGVHQGGPIANIPISAIPDGSITSAKIADGTITAADLAAATITASNVANNQMTNVIGTFPGTTVWSTTSTGSYVVTSITIPVTVQYSSSWVRFSGHVLISHSLLNGTVYLGLGWDGSVQTSFAYYQNSFAGQQMAFSWDFTHQIAAGGHTYALYLNNANPGTVAISNAVNINGVVTEFRR